MGGFLYPPSIAATSGGAVLSRLGARLPFASPAGSIGAAPGGFNGTVGRLLVTLPSGAATWTSLTAGFDGQLLEIRNQDAINALTLPSVNWGGVGDIVLSPGNSILVYYDTTTASWQVTSP